MIKQSLIKKNKKSFCFLFVFLFLFFVLPFPTSAAGVWDTIKNVFLSLPSMFFSAVFMAGVYITYAFAWLMGSLLDFVIDPSFVSLSYTNPKNNEIIKSGLSITQSFVNLLLVVVLVYTALSIALRLNETEAKKMLARLIIVALLVNFAPVFCGLVVDAANIATDYFLKPIKNGPSNILLQMNITKVVSMIYAAGLKAKEQSGVLMAVVAQIALNTMVGIAFLFFAAVFLLRYIAIWTLVILAPIAFVAWIFPSGKMRSLWETWFNQFIQWSIIGIPIAFFLYLAMSSFALISATFKGKLTMPGVEAPVVSLMNDSLPFLVIGVFLFLGFTLGIQTSAMGTEKLIQGFKRGYKASGKTTWDQGKKWVRMGITKAGQEMKELRKDYQIQRIAFKDTRFQSLKTVLKSSWQSRIRPKIKPATFVAASRGIFNAAKDVFKSGFKEGFGIKGKEKAICVKCGNYVPTGASHCPHCGKEMPTCPQCGRRTVPGAKFCEHCGLKLH